MIIQKLIFLFIFVFSFSTQIFASDQFTEMELDSICSIILSTQDLPVPNPDPQRPEYPGPDSTDDYPFDDQDNDPPIFDDFGDDDDDDEGSAIYWDC